MFGIKLDLQHMLKQSMFRSTHTEAKKKNTLDIKEHTYKDQAQKRNKICFILHFLLSPCYYLWVTLNMYIKFHQCPPHNIMAYSTKSCSPKFNSIMLPPPLWRVYLTFWSLKLFIIRIKNKETIVLGIMIIL